MKRLIAFIIAVAMIFSSVPILKAEGEAKIVGILVDGQEQSKDVQIKLPKTGGKLEAKVFTENIAKLEHRAKKDGQFYQFDDYNKNLNPSVVKGQDHFKYNCTIPKNTTENDIVWTLEFKGKNYSAGGKIQVTVSGKEEEKPDVPGPAPDPQPTPGEEKTPEILGYDLGDGKVIKTHSEIIEKKGKSYTLNVKTKNISDASQIIVYLAVKGKAFIGQVAKSITKVNDNLYKIELEVPENMAKSCKDYLYKIGYKEKINNFEIGNYSDRVTFSVNINGTTNKCEVNPDDNPGEKPVERKATISRVSDSEAINDDVLNMEVSPDGEKKKIWLTLINGDILKNEDLGVFIKKDGTLENSIKASFEGENNARVATIDIPKNKSEKDIKYEVTFTIKNKLQNGKKITITQKAKKVEKVANIAIYSLTNENIPLSGGDVTASAFGENFDISKFSIKVFDGEADVTSSIEMDNFVGREDTASIAMKFPKVETEKVYNVKLFYDGKEVGENVLKQNEYGSNNASIDIQANRAIKIDNRIIVEFAHDVFEAYPNALKENIEIAFDGTPLSNEKHESKYVKNEPKYEKLQAEDKVEVKDNKIIVTLAQDRKMNNMPKIRLGFRTFKNPQGVYNGRKNNAINSYFISDSKGVILSAEFLSDDVFLSSGGAVKIKINGLGLSDDKSIATYTRVKVLKNENKENKEKPEEIDATIAGSGKEQILTFKVPENETNRTESYTVSLSTDGRVFLSNINASIYDRANLLVVSVLPKGKNKDDITLGFARITSYGTSGGSTEAPDITHTIPPLGQESKKTWVTIFGTNLKNPMTRIRARAEVPANSGKYVYFYPVNEGTQDSGNKFIMVGVSKGLYGRGNVQMLEVIAPRGYVGDMLYTYEIAVDGVHFDKEITTTVLLLDDKEDGGTRKKHEAFVRDLKIKYEDEEGNSIKAEENMYVMKNQTLRSVGIYSAPEIEGYKYKKLKELHMDISKELSKIQMLKELKKNGNIKAEDLEELDRLEKYVKNSKELEFGNVIGDIPSLTFVYEKITETDKPTPKPEPKPDYRPIEPAPSILDETYRPHYNGKAFTDESGVIVSKKADNKKETSKPEEKEESKILDIKEPIYLVNLTDIPEGPAGDAIKNMVSRGILKGMDNGKFEGELPISRAMVSTVLMRISKDKSVDNLKTFNDLKDSDWFNEAIKWAVKYGVIKGYDDNTVKANELVTRQEFAVMIYRFINAHGLEVENILDIDDSKFADVPEWSKKAVVLLTEAGFINIKGDKFNPNGEFTREELAVTLDKIVKLVEKM